MRKTLIMANILIVAIGSMMMDYTYAVDTAENTPTTVTVTEAIPGLKCTPVGIGDGPPDMRVTKRKYKCEVGGGFGGVMLMVGGLIKYVTFLSILIAVLMLVLSGMKMAIEGKKDDKKMFKRVLVALVVLFSMGLILNSIAPWIYQ